MRIDGNLEPDQAGEKQTPLLRAKLVPFEVVQCHDQAALEARGGQGGLRSTDKLRYEIWLSNKDQDSQDQALNILISQAKNVFGIETEGKTVGEVVNEFPGKVCLAEVVHAPNPNAPERPYVNVKKLIVDN